MSIALDALMFTVVCFALTCVFCPLRVNLTVHPSSMSCETADGTVVSGACFLLGPHKVVDRCNED